jgi:hypothetical protein
VSEIHAVGEQSPDGDRESAPLKVFINYRHEDTQGTAWALYFKLESQLGSENVFFDNGTLRPGMQWLEEVKTHLAGASVLIALVGSRWIPSLITHMQVGDTDYVAKEIDLALRAGPHATVIPVLIDAAQLPAPRDLPQFLKPLRACQEERLRHSHLREDITNLIARLAEIRDEAAQLADRGRAPATVAGS